MAKRISPSTGSPTVSLATQGFAQRLGLAVAAYCQAHQCSQNEVARRAGIGAGTLTQTLKPKRETRLKTALLLAELLKYNVNPLWLLMGTGPDGLKAT